ncbi:hypothetical protein ACFV2N_41450 [Streptomyces sp. NPDC059680]
MFHRDALAINSWHTLGGHFRDSRAFWTAVGAGVPGTYQQRETCPHIPEG